MRRLLILRHAKADRPEGVQDHERPLAERGRTQSAWMGTYLAEQGLRPDLALVSTARRTQETWALARPAFAVDIAQRNDRLLYTAASGALLELIQQVDGDARTLLLVGHNPTLHDLALKLIGSAAEADMSRLRQKYPTAGLLVIDFDIEHWSEASPATGRLDRFITPDA